MRTLVIAEIGVNHNADLAIGERLIFEAIEAGADIAKFQTFTADGLATKSAPLARYQSRQESFIDQAQLLERYTLTHEMHQAFYNSCLRGGIEFLSTGFSVSDVAYLVRNFQLQRFKIPSGEITNLPLLRFVGALNGKVLMSTGMATLREVGEALNVLVRSGTSTGNITVLHCVTSYPTAPAEMNLMAMATMRDEFGVSVGLSDHSEINETSIAAVALGASVIEKHLTLDRSMSGPDHRASIEPQTFSDLVRGIRSVEVALGDGIKRPAPSEVENLVVARRSIVAARDIKSGEYFSDQNLTTKRPGDGLSPMLWDEIVGSRASRDYIRDELIQF